MPRQVPKTITGFGSGASNIAKAEPICMSKIAAIAVGWTEIEEALTSLVNGALGTAQLSGKNAVGMSGNWVAKAAMEQCETIRTRLKLINALIAPMLTGTILLQAWQDLERDLYKSSRKRNAVVHGRWAYTELLPGELVSRGRDGPLRWSQSDFDEVIFDFRRLHMRLMSFSHEIGLAKASGRLGVWAPY